MRRQWRYDGSWRLAAGAASLILATASDAGSVDQPPGSNVTYGDVTHGEHLQSAFTNPAASAAVAARGDDRPTRAVGLAVSAGIEYGNVDDLFGYYDDLAKAFNPSTPGTGGGPGQHPGDKPDGGLDLGVIWDALDPDIKRAVTEIGEEIATQVVILGVVAAEGYGKARVSADLPLVVGQQWLGGIWNFDLNWSGSAKAFGLVEPLDFDLAAAETALRNWFDLPAELRPPELRLFNGITLYYDAAKNDVRLGFSNDSSLVTKASRTTELSVSYGRLASSTDAGQLFIGGKGRLYQMQLSRLSVRFGDITDSKELFDAIRNSDFRDDVDFGIDIGALWVAQHYRLGAQVTNVNEPKFYFPDVDIQPYQNQAIIDFLRRDQTYVMDRQLKLEASIFTADQRWTAHLGVDADSATDALGDDYQWLTLACGYKPANRWIPNVRVGYRRNLSGTNLSYLSAGLSAFRVFYLDIASALDSTRIQGADLPRGLMVSLGFQFAW